MGVSYKIFPSIGIARVGNSDTEFYYGPEKFRALPFEIENGAEVPVQNFRDAQGRLKRQAARFQVWRFESDDDAGTPVEIGQGGVADIRWTAHLANKKAAWYTFRDIEGEHGYAPDHPLRNPQVKDTANRERLIIDPGPLTVSADAPTAEFARGKGQNGYKQTFPHDDMHPRQVNSLGGMRMDAEGRLAVLGGFGNSGVSSLVCNDFRPGGPPVVGKIDTYANNNGWFDDVSDGPVSAQIVLDSGEKVDVDAGAWVLVTPPAFAPQIPNIVTLYDTLYDLYVREWNFNPAIFKDGAWQTDYVADFQTEIEPILQHAETAQWVAAIPPYAHLTLRDMGLGDPSDASRQLRERVFRSLRAPDQPNVAKSDAGKKLMPYQPGDNPFTDAGPKYLTVTQTQYFLLSQWAAGRFTNRADDTSKALTPEAMSQAILQNCVGGPFCPGIEITWIARNPKIYAEPFRIKAVAPGPDGLSLKDRLDEGVEPGDLSKRMAVPWQADFNECSTQDGMKDDMDPFWWPAQRPVNVMLADHQQAEWSRGLPKDKGDSKAGDYAMVTKWDGMGFVINKGSDTVPNYQEVDRDDAIVDKKA